MRMHWHRIVDEMKYKSLNNTIQRTRLMLTLNFISLENPHGK